MFDSVDNQFASDEESMFDSVDNQFAKHGTNWDHCIEVGVDNTDTNISEQNSIAYRVKGKNKNCIIAGCPCHILHNATQKGSIEFTQCTDFDIKDHCLDTFYWFDMSGKRKNILSEYFEL